jgi:hypothetical protein
MNFKSFFTSSKSGDVLFVFSAEYYRLRRIIIHTVMVGLQHYIMFSHLSVLCRFVWVYI